METPSQTLPGFYGQLTAAGARAGQSLSVLIPAFNDAGSLGALLHEGMPVLDRLGIPYEVVILDDGSSDGTQAVIAGLQAAFPGIRAITHTQNQGFGPTFKELFSLPEGDLVFWVPGDGQISIKELRRLLPAMERADAVIGVRIARRDPWQRRAASWLYNAVISLIARRRVRDVNSVVLLRRRVLEGYRFTCRSAFFHAELILTALRRGNRVAEVAIEHAPRRHGRGSGGKLGVIMRTAADVLRYTAVPHLAGMGLLAVLALAAGLRVAALDHGLPHVYEHDELHAVMTALRHAGGNLEPPNFLHGGLTSYLLAGLFGALYLVRHLLGSWVSAQDVVKQFAADPTLFVLLGRSVIALCGVLTVWLTWAAARRLGLRAAAALLAAACVAVSVLHVNMAHLIKEDLLAGTLLAAAFLAAVALLAGAQRRERPRPSVYLLLGLGIGLATAAKYYGAAAFIWVPVLLFAARASGALQGIRAAAGLMAAALLGGLGGFALGNPFALVQPGIFLEHVQGLSASYAQLANISGRPSWQLYLVEYLPSAVGLPAAAAALVGLVWGLRVRAERWRALLLASFPATLIAGLSGAAAFPHFLTPAVPFVALLAALMLNGAMERLPVGRQRRALASGLCAALLAPGLLASLRYDRYAMAPDTRGLAKTWLESHVPPGVRIAVEGAVFESIMFGPPLAEDRQTLEVELARIRERGGEGRLWEAKLAAAQRDGRGRFSVCKRVELTREDLAQCQATVSVVITDTQDRSWSVHAVDRRPFLTDLARDYELVQVFDPYPGVRFFPTMWTLRDEYSRLGLVPFGPHARPLVSGPRIRIYRAREAAASQTHMLARQADPSS